jgi:hypothetical protein
MKRHILDVVATIGRGAALLAAMGLVIVLASRALELMH